MEFGRAVQGVPLDTDGDRKVSINMHIPSKLAGTQKDQVISGVAHLKNVNAGKK